MEDNTVMSNPLIISALDNGWSISEVKTTDPENPKRYHLHHNESSAIECDLIVGDNLYIPSSIVYDDMRLLGFRIYDHRIQIALSNGWKICKGNDSICSLIPPSHFQCKFVPTEESLILVKDITRTKCCLLLVPDYYYDDNVLIFGRSIICKKANNNTTSWVDIARQNTC